MRIFKNDLHYSSSWSNVYLNSKFKAALMFDCWGNREQTHHFLICVWKKHLKYALKNPYKPGPKNGLFWTLPGQLVATGGDPFLAVGILETTWKKKKATRRATLLNLAAWKVCTLLDRKGTDSPERRIVNH